MRAWIQYIGKHTRWAAKYIVFNFHTIIYRHIILDMHSVADPDIAAYVHILP